MAKVTLNDIRSGYITATRYNANNTAIEAGFEKTLSRDGASPNQMEAPLDMNGNLILNQANPITVSGFNWEGPWIMGTTYQIGDVVEVNGTSYIAIVTHIASSTFSADSANWQTVATANLPTQAGENTKFLQTNGTSASWEVPDSSEVTFIQSGTDAVASTVQAKLREWVSVKDFGAVGNGVTDDSEAIQKAINSLTYGQVYFPAGKYYVNSAISLKNKVSIIGNGKAISEIYFGPLGSFALTGLVGARVGYLQIESIGLTNQGAGSPIVLTLTEATYVSLVDTTIYNASITLDAFSYISFEKCNMFSGTLVAHHSTINEICSVLKISLCNTSGYALAIKDTTDVIIETSHFLGAAAQISVSRGEQNSAFYPEVFISDIIVDSGANEGIVLNGVSPKLSNTFVSSGRTNLKDGIYIFDCTEGGLVNVQSRYCGHDGLWMSDCSSITVEGCTFNDNKRYGVRIGDSDNLRFIGNTATNAPSWWGGSYVQTNGIADEPSNSTNIICIGNELGTATPLYLPGVTNTVFGNNGWTEHRLPGTFLVPQVNNTLSLGSSTYMFSEVHSTLIRTAVYIVATLPSAITVGVGTRSFVSDANATTLASIVAGGGTNKVPVYSDGTNWRIG